jgi:hypothetical protein
MLEHFGKGTHVRCRLCGRRNFFTEAKVAVRDGKRLVEVTCQTPGCAGNTPTPYDEVALEIH